MSEDLLSYGMDETGYFYVARTASDGTPVWHHSSEDGTGEFYDVINDWAGSTGGSGTSAGFFIPSYQGAEPNNCGFYLVAPDGTPIGHRLTVESSGNWGMEVIEGADGDHYATYYAWSDEEPAVAGWNGTSTTKWVLNVGDITGDAGEPSAMALSPDGETLVVSFGDSLIIGVDAATGAVLWSHTPTDSEYMGTQSVRVAFTSGGSLYQVGMAEVVSAPTVRAALRLYDFPSGYASAPTETWRKDLSESVRTDAWGMALLPDDSVIVAYSENDEDTAHLTRVALSGETTWAVNTAEDTHWWEAGYAPLVLMGDRVVASQWDENFDYRLVPFSVEDGSLEVREGEAWPLEYWMIGGAPIDSTVAPSVATQDPRDRLRSTISEDLGSLMDAVEAIPVDAGVSVDYTNAVSLEPGVLTTFRELTRATDSDTVDLMYYPRPKQNTRMEEQFDGVTILSRLAAWYPPRMYGKVDTDFSLTSPATPTQIITYVLTAWAAQQPWLTFKTVPDLRLPLGKAPSEYGTTDGLIGVETITIAQDDDRRMTALDILHDLLSPFPGAVLRQDSEGDLVIRAFYGPDADEDPIVTLRTFDVYSVSAGKPDPFTTINRATFQAIGGQTRTVDTSIMQKSWFQIGSNYRLGDTSGAWFDPPMDAVNLQPDGDDILQEGLSVGQFGQQKPTIWPVGEDAIIAGGGVRIEDELGDPTINAAWRIFGPSGGLSSSDTGPVTVVTSVIPFTGEWVTAFSWSADIYVLNMRARWNAAANGVEWSIGSSSMEGNCWSGCWSVIVEFVLTDSSVGYTDAGMTSVTFGLVENGDSIPSNSGGNAVAESQTEFGVRERQVTINGYALDAETLTQAARGYVLHNITPRVTRDIELSVAGSVAITFDHVGRLIELPSGGQGVLTGVQYADEFTTGNWSKTIQVQISDTSQAGGTDPSAFETVMTNTGGQVFTSTDGEPFTVTGE